MGPSPEERLTKLARNYGTIHGARLAVIAESRAAERAAQAEALQNAATHFLARDGAGYVVEWLCKEAAKLREGE